MDFEALKNKWNSENPAEVNIPSTIARLKKAQHPLEKLRRTMKNECWSQLAAVLFAGAIPQVFGLSPAFYVVYYTAYSMLLVTSGYYFYEFYQFYKEVGLYHADTHESLWKIYYELRLNMERYQSFGFLLLPYFLVATALLGYDRLISEGKTLQQITSQQQVIILLVTLFSTLLAIGAIVLWTRYVYGKTAREIDGLLKEIKDEI
ncbi:hypothetical protein GCM10023091_12360 [Ravibacter arvi]|uniref:Uncharacterized protein n=1 Tax=Ravibacter arvi TaxID=2051041 RepID=A0ABP8LUA2_9BACT